MHASYRGWGRKFLLLAGVLQLITFTAAGVIRDGGIDPNNLGKGEWLYFMSSATNQLGGYEPSVVDEHTLMEFLKSQGTRYIIVKAATSDKLFNGSYSFPQFTSNLVDIAHQHGLLIFGYNRSYGANVPAEIAIADYVFNQGADGFVWDAEAEWESSQPWIGANGPALAWELCSTVRSNWPTKFLAHAPFPIINLHSSFPYKEFNYWSDAIMPQIYHFSTASIKKSVSAAINWTDVNWAYYQQQWANLPPTNINGLLVSWTNAIKPIVPIQDVYGPPYTSPTPDKDVMEFMDYLAADPNSPAVGGINGANFFRADLHDAAQWSHIKAGTPGSFPGVVNSIVIDSPRAAAFGPWASIRTFYVAGLSSPQFQGNGSLTDTNSFGTNYLTISQGSGANYVEFVPKVVTAGRYEVLEWHPYRVDASTGVTHVVYHKDGASTVFANQKMGDGNWNSLGTFFFNAGTNSRVQVLDAIADPAGVAIADAIKLVYIPDSTNPPAAPTAVSASAITSSKIVFVWQASPSNVVNYVVGRSTTDGGPYTDVAVLANNRTNYSDSGLTPATTYYYVVRALNAYGASSNSEQRGATTLSGGASPIITLQPKSQTVPVGTNVIFTVGATNALYYQWRFEDQPIPGATSSAYPIFYVDTTNAGYYSVTVSNNFEATDSAPALLTVIGDTAPYFITLPESKTVIAGQAATFSVIAGGTPPPAYEWRFNSVTMSGETDATLTLNDVQPANTGLYTVVLSNSVGTITSPPAFLSVNYSLTTYGVSNGTISAYPSLPSYPPGTNVTLTAVPNAGFIFTGWSGGVIGTENPVQLVMASNMVVLAGFAPSAADLVLDNTDAAVEFVGGWSTGSSASGRYGPDYRFASTIASGAGTLMTATYRPPISVPGLYRIYVMYPQGSNRATNAPFTVQCDSGILQASINQQVNGGTWFPLLPDTVHMSPGADQWVMERNDTGYSGKVVIADALRFVLVQADDGPPVVISGPLDQLVLVGGTASFSVAAAGKQPLTYFWYKNDVLIPGATDSVYSYGPVQAAHSGAKFRCYITNELGNSWSSNATLFVSGSLVYKASFENGLEGFTINDAYGSGNGLWHLSTGRANDPGHSPTHSLYYGKGETITGGGNYDTGTANGGVAISPPINLPASGPIKLGFNYFMSVEGSTYWDRAYVEVSTNGGASFSIVAEKDATNGFSSGTGGAWVSNTVDLASYAGKTIQLRFRFETGDGVANSTEGWYLDDITITGSPVPPVITREPSDVVVVAGKPATFSVEAVGATPLLYLWHSNNVPIADGTNSSYVIPHAQLSDSGTKYYCTVTNDFGWDISSDATLTVVAAPVCVPAASNLVGWWKGEGNAWDEFAGNDGTSAGVVSFAPGYVGQSFVFDGYNTCVRIGNPAALQTQNFTIEAWVKRASASVASYSAGGGLIFGYGSGGYALGINDDGSVFLMAVDMSNVTVSAGLTDTNYHHLAVTKSGSTIIFYVDGVAFPAPAYDPGFLFGNEAGIGARSDTLGNAFLGNIDEVTIYSRPLAASEIQAIFFADVSGKCVLAAPPAFTLQPISATIDAGTSFALTAAAQGSPQLRYQWYHDGVAIAGKVLPTLYFADVQTHHAGDYYLEVTNAYGKMTSATGHLDVLFYVPEITQQPADASAAAGASAYFGATASGTAPLSYQWYFEGTPLSGQTFSYLTLYNVQPTNAGNYYVYVTNLYGNVTSSNAYLTVLTYPPNIISGPVSRTVYAGKTVSFSGSANGTAPLRYQWFFESYALPIDTNLPMVVPLYGKTNYSLTLTNVQFADAGNYFVQVTNLYGSEFSSKAALTVLPPPVCVTAPTGLVSWWRGETNLVDTTSANDLYWNAYASGYSTGKVAGAFRLVQGGYLRTSTATNLLFNLGPNAGFTMEGWINPVSLSSPQPIIEWNDGVGRIGAGLMLNPQGGYGCLEGWLTATNTSPTRVVTFRTEPYAVTNLTWTHVALTFDTNSGNATLYVNGQPLRQTNLVNFLPITRCAVTIGGRVSGTWSGSRFSGSIDEMSIYNRALSTAELQSVFLADEAGKCPPPPPPCVAPPTGIVSWWRGESNALDSIDLNIGNISNVVTYTTGIVGQAFQFTTGFIKVPAASNLNVGVGPGLTMELWVKPNVYGAQPFIEWNTAAGQQGPTLCYSTAAPALESDLVDTNGVSHLVRSPTGLITNNAWQHFAITYDKASGGAALYINGNAVTQRNIGTFTPRTTAGVFLGYRPPGTYTGAGAKFTGTMDEPAIYARALSAQEIRSIYLAREKGKCLSPAAPFVISQPASRTVTLGSNTVFSVVSAGSAPLSYHWKKSGTNIDWATGSVLTITNAGFSDAGYYSVEIANSGGSVSSTNASLTINQPPTAPDVFVATKQNKPVGIVPEKLWLFATDPENDPLVFASFDVKSTNGGTIAVSSGLVNYTPPDGYVGHDRFGFVIKDTWGGASPGFVQVEVRPADQISGNMLPLQSIAGGYRVRFAGIPNRTYTVERAQSITGPWTPLTAVTIGPNGIGVLEDTNAPAAGAYYRTTYP